MNINFDLENVTVTEFGVGRYNEDSNIFSLISSDAEIQDALKEMAEETLNCMMALSDEPILYDPSEKYKSQEYLYLPIDNDLAQRIHTLHSANNLDIDNNALENPDELSFYFARFIDGDGNRLTAIRRTTQFKGVLKKRLIRLVTDTMRIVDDNIFKLDNDFDLLADNQNVHILRPSGLEFIGQLKNAILEAVPGNIDNIRQEMDFVDFSNIQSYAETHSRAARYLASIHSREEMVNIDRDRLVNLCNRTGVQIDNDGEDITIDDKDIMGFLEVLDRRRYEVDLVHESPESYKASSRSRLNRGG